MNRNSAISILIRNHPEEFKNFFNSYRGYVSRNRARSNAVKTLIDKYQKEFLYLIGGS